LTAQTNSTPQTQVCDLASVAEIAQSAGAKLVVENTFASPFLCNPLNFGADLVVHSTTKYLSGHGDSTGGIVVTGKEADRRDLIRIRKLAGGVLSVWEAHQILRGIKTLSLRHQRQCENAAAIAEKLHSNPRVDRVYFPNTADNLLVVGATLRTPYFGALVTIRLKDDSREAAFRFMDSLDLCIRATSLGDVQTLVSHPATSSHRELTSEEKQVVGISEGMVRISVGIEDAGDLIDDIEQALGKSTDRTTD
jgi:cystathionine gamma-synthase/methionine-gamma-lyase